MARWHRELPLSAAIRLVDAIDSTDRIRVEGNGYDITGRLPVNPSATLGEIESYAQFEFSPLDEEEPITGEAEHHTVRVDIFENVNREDISVITAEIRPRDADPTDTIDEFPVESFAVIEEARRPELLVNDDFDPAEVENEERAERLKQIDEMVRSDTPYYEVINKVGLGRDIEKVRRDDVATELMERGYVTQTLDGEYRLTDRGRRMHTLFSDYIYGDPG